MLHVACLHSCQELIIKKMAPKPGQGPSRKTMMEGSWTVDIYGKAVPKEGGAPSVVRGTVAGKHDPGYMDTSRMLLECALALSLQVGKEQALKAPRVPDSGAEPRTVRNSPSLSLPPPSSCC